MHYRFGSKIALGAACVVAIAVATAAGAEPVLPKAGTYLSSAYIATLQKKKSHFAAVGASADPQAVFVEYDTQGNVALNAVVGFYQQVTAVYDPKQPTFFEDPEGGAKKPFAWIDATHFKIGRGKAQLTYTYVGDGQELGGEQSFLIATMLAGTYRDARGQTYVFGADGKAQFPDGAFRVEILTNTLDESWDQIITHAGENEPGRDDIAFAWRGKALFLYNCDPAADTAGCTPDRKHPIAVLHKAD
jgi:hypothetical protein